MLRWRSLRRRRSRCRNAPARRRSSISAGRSRDAPDHIKDMPLIHSSRCGSIAATSSRPRVRTAAVSSFVSTPRVLDEQAAMRSLRKISATLKSWTALAYPRYGLASASVAARASERSRHRSSLCIAPKDNLLTGANDARTSPPSSTRNQPGLHDRPACRRCACIYTTYCRLLPLPKPIGKLPDELRSLPDLQCHRQIAACSTSASRLPPTSRSPSRDAAADPSMRVLKRVHSTACLRSVLSERHATWLAASLPRSLNAIAPAARPSTLPRTKSLTSSSNTSSPGKTTSGVALTG